MATIWDNVVFDPCQRPAYTKYELSKMVAEKRFSLGLNIEDFSILFGIPSQIVASIEEAKRSFNVPMYKVCSAILGMDMNEILRTDQEDIGCVEFRTNEVSKDALNTVHLANVIFNEMVMQQKISAR